MEHERFNWKTLRRSKCPKCNDDLRFDDNVNLFRCDNIICDFKISNERFKEIVGDMNKQALEVPMYRHGEEVEDLHRVDWPVCDFCRLKHDPQRNCEGFI